MPTEFHTRRSVPVPLWLLIGALALMLVLAGLGGAALVLMAQGGPQSALPVVQPSATASASAIQSPASTPSPTARPMVRLTASPAASKARPAAPRGVVYVERPKNGGQGTGRSPDCAEWNLTLVNDSSREVTSLRWKVTSAEYVDYSGDFDPTTETYPTKTARTPIAQTLRLSVPAHTRQVFQVTSCTTTPWPGGGYSYDETTVRRYAITWAGGFDGYATWRD